MIFYDFEVFKYDWLVVALDAINKTETVIINDPGKLHELYQANKNNIWIGFNSKHYDQYILKGILCGFNPKKVNDHIIRDQKPGWTFSTLFRDISINNYDVMNSLDPGLKTFEGFLGNDIRESGVPFDIDRPLTESEIAETVEYCRHDVEQTIEVFLERSTDFEARLGLVKIACGDKPLRLSLLEKTPVQLSAMILEARKQNWNDEFDIDFPKTLKIEKYREVVEWYKQPSNRCYKDFNGEKTQLEIMVAGVPHVFGWGGVHGAIPKYNESGYFINMDVASLYPSLMIVYDLGSRSMKNPKKYEEIYHQRLKWKAEKNPLQQPLKLVLNGTYGAMKDQQNPLYDPRQANRVCVYGQLLLLDLIEKLEPHCEIIQSNTDGVLIRKPDGESEDEFFQKIDDVAAEWEERTKLTLEFDEYKKIYQKDVNNYLIIDAKGKHKAKGAYVKKLSNIDNDLPIVNKALIDYMVKGVSIEKTIRECDDLKMFQKISKISRKYSGCLHGSKSLNERCLRVFASNNPNAPGVFKIHAGTGRAAKIEGTPERCFIFNGSVNGVSVPEELNKDWYISTARKRLEDFGIGGNQSLFSGKG